MCTVVTIFSALLFTENSAVVISIYNEGHTLIPFLEKISSKFNLDKPVVVADAGLLSKGNIKALKENGYEYILGARLKNEPEGIKKKILQLSLIHI
mgnify:CR=1 FL=1